MVKVRIYSGEHHALHFRLMLCHGLTILYRLNGNEVSKRLGQGLFRLHSADSTFFNAFFLYYLFYFCI